MAKNKNPTISTLLLLNNVAAKFDKIPKKITKDLLQSFLGKIEEHVTSGDKVRIDKLGILHVKDRAARKGRNPQSGEEIAIPASKKVTFRISSSLKEAVGIKKKKESKPATAKKASTVKLPLNKKK